MSALFAAETEFWMWLKTTDLFVFDLEWHYHANAESMVENYSLNSFPPIKLEEDNEKTIIG